VGGGTAEGAEGSEDAEGGPLSTDFFGGERGSRKDEPIQPSPQRLNFDLAMCQALGVPISRDELIQTYEVFVKEMILIRGLKRD
jgi:hypothetical protein